MRTHWIDRRLKEVGRDKTGLARALKLDPPRVSEIISGKRKVQVTELPVLVDYLEISLEEVVRRITGGQVQPSGNRMISIEVVGSVQAGNFKESFLINQEEREVIVVPRPTSHRRHVALELIGKLMDLDYPPSTILICVPIDDYGQPQPGDHVIVEQQNDDGLVEGTCKELVFDDTGRPWLVPRSSDPRYQAIPMPESDADTAGFTPRITFVVVGDCRIRGLRSA